jgi:hypothetical protein
MKYDLNKLNPTDFESMVQSLSKRILGNGAISFGEGPDGGREAVFTGSAPFPSATENWNGYWVVQAKFKSVSIVDENKDFKWVQKELKAELQKYGSRKIKVKQPDNYLIFTNVVLTAKAGNGGRDRATELEQEYQKSYGIQNIRIIPYDDIIDYLDANRDLAIAYSPFILPGDILSKLLNLLDIQSNRAFRTKQILVRFLEYEFLEDMQAKLDHAGKLTSEKVNLENVFIDLYATVDGQFNEERNDSKFVRSIIEKGNAIIKGGQSKSRYVLIAGPGYGKSTLSQFLIQTHRAFFIADADKGCANSEAVTHFLQSFNNTNEIGPKWIRFPIKIILKEFAGWIRDRIVGPGKLGTSLLEYITFNINRKSSGGDITMKELEELLHNLPCIFVFDGLDEVPSSSNRSIVVSELSFFSETILRRIDADAIVIATTRPQGYSKEFDNSKFQHLYVTDFERSDCVTYLNRLLSKLIDDLDERNQKLQIITKALDSVEIGRLMKSPLQASIMAILVKSGGNPPSDKFELFTNYYDIIFKREKQRGISIVLNERPEYVQEIHNRLGLFLQTVSEGSTNPSATILKVNFIKMVNDYLKEIELDEDIVVSLTHEIVTAATDRLVFISEVEDEKFGFAIRSLQEYFAAHGFLHHVRETMIRDRLYAICKSSYWSNTLLFAIGYIAKTKSYLTDSIESICYELNGSTNEGGEKSLTSIVKIGSWIALDIVNEGIFRGKPIIENKFCNLLEPLIYILPNEKHKEISKLPAKIVEKWIKPLLEKAISSWPTNATALAICSQLEKSGHNSIQMIMNHWPDERSKEACFINTFATAGINSDFIIEKFIRRMETGEIEPFLNLFDTGKSYEFIEAVCLSDHNSEKSKSVLFELIFISSISNEGPNVAISSLRRLGADLPSTSLRDLGWILRNAADKFIIDIVDGYSYEITKGRVQNNMITTLRDYAADKSINLVLTICNFLEEPSSEKFENVNTHIGSLSDSYRAFVISHLRSVNSFFAFVYQKSSLSLLPTWRQALEEIENCNLTTLAPERKLQLRKYSNISTYSSGNFASRLDEFIKVYITSSGNPSKLAYSNFFRLLDWYFTKMSKAELEIFKQKHRLELVRKAIFEHAETEPIYFHNFSCLFYFLTVTEVSRIIHSKQEILNFKIEIITEARARWNYDPHIFDLTFPKIVELVTLQIIQKEEPSYKILLQQIVVGLILEYKFDYASLKLPKTVSDHKNEKYKAAIILLQDVFGESDYHHFVGMLSADTTTFLDRRYIKVLLYVLRFSPKNTITGEIFKFLDSKIIDEEDRNELHIQIKQFIGNQQSGVANLPPIMQQQ